MGLRSAVGDVLDRTLGPSALRRVRRREAAARRRIIEVLDVEAKTRRRRAAERAAQRAAEPKPTPEELRAQLIERLGSRSLEGAVNQEDLVWATDDPCVAHPPAGLTRHELLQHLHRLLQPRTYFEIGVRFGDSLALSRTRSIGVDPAFAIKTEVQCDVRLFRATSDDFFERPDAFAHFGGTPIDLAFIDGMHLAEYALRDFINVERHCSPGSVVVFDDVLPRNHLEAYRVRRTVSWAGDVFKLHGVLRRLRPDLVLVPLNTRPTGTLLVANLDPDSQVLPQALPHLEAELTSPDPQTVPERWLTRADAVDPDLLLAGGVWPRVVALREADAPGALSGVWAELADLPRLSAGEPADPDTSGETTEPIEPAETAEPFEPTEAAEPVERADLPDERRVSSSVPTGS